MKRRKRVARKAAKRSSRSRRRTLVAPRTFEEVRAANLADPVHAARIARLNMGEHFDDAAAKSDDPFVREVSVHPDCEGRDFWQVEWGVRTFWPLLERQ